MSYLDVFNQIKSLENSFPLPIDYITVDVGTFDASNGTFTGLTSSTETDPEPVEHQPGQRPVNPPPHFTGSTWVSITIDSRWRRTITTVPAPKVGLAPVLLKFSIRNNGGAAWSVIAAGSTVNVPAGQSSVTVNIWDLTNASWTVQSGARSHSDRVMIQRSANKLVGAGAFTIPALPLSIVYAPPADSSKQSKASYGVSTSIGTTSTYQFSNDSSTSHPALPFNLDGLKSMQDGLKNLSDALSFAPDADLKALGKVLGTIASGIGTISGTDTNGTVDQSGSSISITETRGQTIVAETKNGGPGAGDSIHYIRDAKFAWLMSDGRLKICLLGGIYASFPASFLATNDPTLPHDVVQALLALDPFVAGGNMVQLPSDRFEEIDAQVQGPFDYGGGQTLTGSYSQTFTTTETRSHNTYTTHVQDFQPGWLGKLFGASAGGLKTTVSMTQTAGSSSSSTQSITWELHSGPTDRFVVEIWRDRIFGTYAFRQEAVAATPRLQGVAPGMSNGSVRLTVGARTYTTITGKDGSYTFYAAAIAAGTGTLHIGNKPPVSVSIPVAKLPAAS